ncbi:MAG: PIN domain nuclease, partial [Nitrospirae bacterium]|nr:PIN domain nuclease [Nitrospirota bacterium]
RASKKLAGIDPDDIELLALALKLKIPIWSNDHHFQKASIEVSTTAQLLKVLGL